MPAGAQTVPNPPASGGCVRAKFVGNATTYNPYKAGWKTGGTGLATGGTYNPNGWEAALQLDLAKQYGCGYGSGKVCHAVVEGNGKSMIVQINDNGPMCADPATARRAADCTSRTSRVIDLNEKSMQYLGGGGSNSGLVKNVTVTLLCDFNNKLGPLDEKERQEWIKKVINTPVSNVSTGGTLSPTSFTSSLSPSGTGGLTGGLSSYSTLTGAPSSFAAPTGYAAPQPSYTYTQPSYQAPATVQPTSYFPSTSGSYGSPSGVTQGTIVPNTAGVIQPNSSAGTLLTLLQGSPSSTLSPLVLSAEPNPTIAIATRRLQELRENASSSPDGSLTTITIRELVTNPQALSQQTFPVGTLSTQSETQNQQGAFTSTINALRSALDRLIEVLTGFTR